MHTSFNQAVAATGRLSSSDPNLQNIPIRTPLGREIRAAFVAEPGHVLVSADYSQIELRVLAHLSGDETLVEAFRRGEDIHDRTAEQQYVGCCVARFVGFLLAYSVGKKNLAEHQPALERAAGVLARTADLLLELADEDAAAYTLVNELSKLPETDERKRAEWGGAVEAAVNVPRAVVGSCCDLLRLLERTS